MYFILDCDRSSLLCASFLYFLLVGATLQLRFTGFSLYFLQSTGSRARVQRLRRTGLVALPPVESSQTRDGAHLHWQMDS